MSFVIQMMMFMALASPAAFKITRLSLIHI